MKAVFADTFYWVALTNPDDTRYRDAIGMDKTLTDALIFTTDEVLVEFMTFFSAGPWQRGRAAATVRWLLLAPEVRVEALTNDRHFEQEGFRALFRES